MPTPVENPVHVYGLPQTIYKIFFYYAVVENNSPRIVGGVPAAMGEFPYQCFLRGLNQDGVQFNCGCSLLNSNWAVTAAHCTEG